MVDQNQAGARTATTVQCDGCKKETTVPFVPTPGRPVYCKNCFMKRQNPGAPTARIVSAPGRDKSRARRKMMKQGRKSHFLYDARELLEREDAMDTGNHRAFLEGLFARGARNGTESAYEFLDEKLGEEIITKTEHKGLMKLVDRYSTYR